jgi:hypothetical protein
LIEKPKRAGNHGGCLVASGLERQQRHGRIKRGASMVGDARKAAIRILSGSQQCDHLGLLLSLSADSANKEMTKKQFSELIKEK